MNEKQNEDTRWDEGWVNSETLQLRLQQRNEEDHVMAWRTYAHDGVHVGTAGDVRGQEHWFPMTTLPHVRDTDKSEGLYGAMRVALLGGRWESIPKEPIELKTPGVSWQLFHGYLNGDKDQPVVILDGEGGVFGRNTPNDDVQLEWSGFQAFFLPGLAQIVDMLSLRTGVLWTTHVDVGTMNVARSDDRRFHPLGLVQLDSKRSSPHLTVNDKMNFATGVRRDPGNAVLSPEGAHIQDLLGREIPLRHELLFDAKRIEVMSRAHNTSLHEHEWLDRSRFMILCMAMECAMRDLARAAAGDDYDDTKPLGHLPGSVAKRRPDWDMRSIPELYEAFDVVRELRNAVAHGRHHGKYKDRDYEVNTVLPTFTIYLSRAIWQIVSFCDGCLEDWDWAAARAKEPLPPHRLTG